MSIKKEMISHQLENYTASIQGQTALDTKMSGMERCVCRQGTTPRRAVQ